MPKSPLVLLAGLALTACAVREPPGFVGPIGQWEYDQAAGNALPYDVDPDSPAADMMLGTGQYDSDAQLLDRQAGEEALTR